MAARRNRDRDSGINDPGDETLNNPERLNTIEEDSDDSPHQDDSPLHTPPEDVPEDFPIPMAVAASAGGVLPGQLSALPLFDGERGEAFVNWLEVIENAEMTYNWTDAYILSVVRSKGGPKIAEWIRAKRFMGH